MKYYIIFQTKTYEIKFKYTKLRNLNILNHPLKLVNMCSPFPT